MFVFPLSKLFVNWHKNDLESQAATLVLPIVTSLLNTFVPLFYSWLGHLERFQTPGYRIYVTITRYLLLPLLSAFCLKLSDTYFDIKLCLGGVVGSRKPQRRIRLLQRFLYALLSMFCLFSVSPLECYISAGGWGMVSTLNEAHCDTGLGFGLYLP